MQFKTTNKAQTDPVVLRPIFSKQVNKLHDIIPPPPTWHCNHNSLSAQCVTTDRQTDPLTFLILHLVMNSKVFWCNIFYINITTNTTMPRDMLHYIYICFYSDFFLLNQNYFWTRIEHFGLSPRRDNVMCDPGQHTIVKIMKTSPDFLFIWYNTATL